MKTVSKSPISENIYDIPEQNSESHVLDGFIKKNKKLKRKIVGIIGLGFVGAATATLVSNSYNNEFCVIGFDQAKDKSYWKIGDINCGIIPLNCGDNNLTKAFKNAYSADKIIATSDLSKVSLCEVIIVAINLDVNKSYQKKKSLKYSVEIEPYLFCIKKIAKKIKRGTLLLLESTLPVGFTEYQVAPLIEKEFKKRGFHKDDFFLGHSYERVTPGPNYLNSMKNFYRVYSAINKKSNLATKRFLECIINTKEFKLTYLESPRASEMAKLLENSYRSMNIAFAIEWSRFAESFDVNLYDVVNAIRLRPTHSNLMYPGIGVGGYCLTKDGLIADHSFPSGTLKMTVNALIETDKMPKYAYDFVLSKLKKSKEKKVNCIIAGVAYSPGVGDTRFSPVEGFYKKIKFQFDNCLLLDPFVNFWEEISKDVNLDLSDLDLTNVTHVFICTKHQELISILNKIDNMKRATLNVYDLVGLYQIEGMQSYTTKFREYHLLGFK